MAAGGRLRTEGGQQWPEEGRGLKIFKKAFKRAPIEDGVGSIELESDDWKHLSENLVPYMENIIYIGNIMVVPAELRLL